MTCGKTAGMFTCRGCSKTFCLQHTNEHRHVLEKEMNEIVNNHDRLQQHITQKKPEKYYQTLLEQIDQWEQQSIDKIHQTASEVRQELITISRGYHDNIEEKLTQLTRQLDKATHDQDYFENDLKQWTDVLQKLQHDFIEQQDIKIYQVNNLTPFISKISLTDKKNDGISYRKYETDDNQPKHRAKLGLEGEYSSDDHIIRFILQQYHPNSQVLIGVISKSTSNDADPYNNPTFYGWACDNLVYLHGDPYSNYHNYRSDIKKNDIFQLFLDCDRQIIRLTNERTSLTYELKIDIKKCPFPWQPHVRLINTSE
jgi:archaellum component FlaC